MEAHESPIFNSNNKKMEALSSTRRIQVLWPVYLLCSASSVLADDTRTKTSLLMYNLLDRYDCGDGIFNP